MSNLTITRVNTPKGKYSIKCPYTMKPEVIVVHNTANDASAMSEISYMLSNNKSNSFHFAVDDTRAVQGLPLDRNGYHAGDGRNGKGNRKGIGVEICYSKSGGEKFNKAEKNASILIAMLLKQYGFGIDKVTQHKAYSGKNCPHRTIKNGWNRFVKMVQSELDKLIGKAETVTKPEVEKEVKLIVDGHWGTNTTKELQRHFGSTQDGIISGQYNTSITRRIPSVRFGNSGIYTGSNVVRRIQKELGVTADGWIGRETIKAMQKRYGTPVDGVLSSPSMMVKAMQKSLNEGKF